MSKLNLNFTASFGSVTLKVTPEKMYNTASSINAKIDKTKNYFAEITDIMKNTASYWEGSLGTAERKNLSKEQENINNIISNLSVYVTELRQITANYAEAEEEITDSASGLPSNILD